MELGLQGNWRRVNLEIVGEALVSVSPGYVSEVEKTWRLRDRGT